VGGWLIDQMEEVLRQARIHAVAWVIAGCFGQA
jgi:hypothetical protein